LATQIVEQVTIEQPNYHIQTTNRFEQTKTFSGEAMIRDYV